MQVNPPASVSSCQGQGHFSPVSGGITNISHFPIVTNYSVPTSNRFQSLQEWNEDFPPLPSSENSEEEMRAVNPLEAEGGLERWTLEQAMNLEIHIRGIPFSDSYKQAAPAESQQTMEETTQEKVTKKFCSGKDIGSASVSSCQGQGHFSPVSGGITNISHFPIVTNYSVPTSNRFQSLQEWNEDFPPLPSSENSEEEMRAVNPLEAEGVISEANTDNPTKTGMKRRDVSPVSEYLNQPQNRNLKRKLNEVQSSINQNPTILNKKSVEMPYSDLLSISVEAQVTEDNQKFPDDFTIAKFLSSIFGKEKFEFEVNKTRERLLIHTKKRRKLLN
ncbi:hypothetical protein QYM36_004151, partial [Artemia franciscana]